MADDDERDPRDTPRGKHGHESGDVGSGAAAGRQGARLPVAIVAAAIVAVAAVVMVLAHGGSTTTLAAERPSSSANTAPESPSITPPPSASAATNSHQPATIPARTSAPRPRTTGSVITGFMGYPKPGMAASTFRHRAPGTIIDGGVDLAWAAQGDELLVITYGSSSCPQAVEQVYGTGPGSIELIMTPAPGTPNPPTNDDGSPHYCTMDLVPYTSVVAPPPGTGATEPLKITIRDKAMTLPPR